LFYFICGYCNVGCGGKEFQEPVIIHVGIAHTRWATHGVPCEKNSHPQRSDIDNSFVVVHNGIITNYKDVKTYLEKRGYEFESDTDTEVIAKLVHHLWKKRPGYSFRELVEQAIQQLVIDNKHVQIELMSFSMLCSFFIFHSILFSVFFFR